MKQNLFLIAVLDAGKIINLFVKVVQLLLIGDFKCTKMWSLLVASVGSECNYDFAAASPKENKQTNNKTHTFLLKLKRDILKGNI